MRRKGFLYTTFAIFLLGLIGLAIIIPVNIDAPDRATTNTRVDELYFFTESVKDDIERAISIIGTRSLVAVTNTVVQNESGIDDPSFRIAEVFLNGTVGRNSSQIMDDSTFRDWIASMEAQAQREEYEVNISTDHSLITVTQDDPFTLAVTINHTFAIEDTAINTGFDEGWRLASETLQISGIDDALLLLETGARRFNQYRACEQVGAEQALSGTESEYNYTSNGTERSWASGDAFQFNGSSLTGIEQRDEKILVTDDLCDYDETDLDDFSGVISEQTTDGQAVCESNEEIPGYIGGVTDHTIIQNGTRIVMDGDEVWHQHIPKMIDDRCYFPDPNGPSFLDRLAGEYAGSNQGIGSLLNIPELPPDIQKSGVSPVDHLYFDPDDEADTLHQVKGVSNHQEWFVLDDQHIEQWNMSAMTY